MTSHGTCSLLRLLFRETHMNLERQTGRKYRYKGISV